MEKLVRDKIPEIIASMSNSLVNSVLIIRTFF